MQNVVFLAADRTDPIPQVRGGETAWEPPACLVQLVAERWCDDESQHYGSFHFEAMRFGGRSTSEVVRRFTRFADSAALVDPVLIITMGGRRSLLPWLRWMSVITATPCPIAARTWEHGVPPGGPRQTNFELAQYFLGGNFTPDALLARLLLACGVSASIIIAARESTPSGAFMRALAICLLYLRTQIAAGVLTNEADADARSRLCDLILKRFPARGVAIELILAFDRR